MPAHHKKCLQCHADQSYDNFPLVGIFGTTHGRVCYTCIALNRETCKALTKANRPARARKSRTPGQRTLANRQGLEKSYGLSPGDYELLLKSQDHACAICHQPATLHPAKQRLAIDHDHATGEVRGLLCTSCNWALGRFHDSIPLLQNAIRYLRKASKHVPANDRPLPLFHHQTLSH